MTPRPRLLTHFVSRDGSIVVELPKAAYEWESSQGVRGGVATAIGADYGVDLLGTLVSPVAVGSERVRGLLVAADGETLTDALVALRGQLQAIGQGRLRATDAAGGYWWARARIASMPEVTLGVEHRRHAPVIVAFQRLSDWFAEDVTTVTQTITGGAGSISLTNGGTADVREIVVEIRANAASGYVNPSITSVLTGETFTYSRTAASSTHRVRIDCGRYAVTRSTDSGTTWADDYAQFSAGLAQDGFIRLIPGAQSWDVAGCANATVVVTYRDAWR